MTSEKTPPAPLTSSGTDSGLLQKLTDEAAIRALTARFTDAVIRRDYDGFRGLWRPDAIWEIREPLPSTAQGVEQITTMLRGLLDAFEFFVQMVHSGVIAIDGDHATARWVVQEIGRAKGGTRYYDNYALYEDVMTRVDGQWQFVRRAYDYIYLDDSAFFGRAYALPADLGSDSVK